MIGVDDGQTLYSNISLPHRTIDLKGQKLIPISDNR